MQGIASQKLQQALKRIINERFKDPNNTQIMQYKFLELCEVLVGGRRR